MKNLLQKITVSLFACALWIAPFRLAMAAEYSFKVHNTTKNTITKLLASEDGKTFGFFDIGKGIKPDATMTLQWDKSTENGKCKQWFKAVFDDGEESEAHEFDFCEEELTLEF
jgi:hypothetical protein